jgi:hypothetical protein
MDAIGSPDYGILVTTDRNLTERHVGFSDSEILWVVRNGLKITGMPAFQETCSDAEIWAIVAFMRSLPHIYPEDYRAVVKGAPEGRKEE